MQDHITIKGARVHNLKNINLKIPRNKLIVITGISGSGKSSLAFDTIYAEGQRLYVESLSIYARQFLGLMDKPDVDDITGLSPAISIDQKTRSHNPRSTVGTVTEIYDYLRLLYARVGRPHCPQCGKLVKKQTVDQIIEKIAGLEPGTKFMLLSPIIKEQKGEHKKILREIERAGYSRVRLDGEVVPLDEALDMNVDAKKKHTIEVVVDRLEIPNLKFQKPNKSQIPNSKYPDAIKQFRSRLTDSLESALDLGDGVVVVVNVRVKAPALTLTEKELLFSQSFNCPYCDISLPNFEPRHFSFNNPHGACPECTGLGVKNELDPDLIIPNKNLSVLEGAVKPWMSSVSGQSYYFQQLRAVAEKHKIPLDKPVSKLSKEQLKLILFGTGKEKYKVNYQSDKFNGDFWTNFEGVILNLERRYRETDSDFIRQEIERYMRIKSCPECQGKRLRREVLSVTLAGLSINKAGEMTIEQAEEFFSKIVNIPQSTLNSKELQIASPILKEIKARLSFLLNVGLSYLTLNRAANSLSGGEAQRIRLATQIGSKLTGVIYILDEPSIGLHQRDNQRLIKTLIALRDLGSTVIVVEHDEEMIKSADWVVDIGPGAGEQGGQVVAQGTPKQIMRSSKSLTGQYLAGKKKINIKEYEEEFLPEGKNSSSYLNIIGASHFNLKNINVKIPLAKFVCITGVSGSGKSTLVDEILSKALRRHFYQAKDLPGQHKEIKGLNFLDKVITIDQSPIGRTPRSNPATYTGVLTPIRELFSQTPEAKIRGYKPGRFSFNVKGGRCEACQGDGLVKIEMHFLSDVYVECEECHSQRYNRETLEVHYKNKNISDILNMTVKEALGFFQNILQIKNKLMTLNKVGLGYIKLGQSATTLSGGEAQRVKLAAELSRRSTGKTLYILDEPTTGLHFADVEKLLKVLHKLVEKGNTVLVIEHNLDVIKNADFILDLGPEGGDMGGEIIAAGSPQEVAKIKKSYTGQFLAKMLKI